MKVLRIKVKISPAEDGNNGVGRKHFSRELAYKDGGIQNELLTPSLVMQSWSDCGSCLVIMFRKPFTGTNSTVHQLSKALPTLHVFPFSSYKHKTWTDWQQMEESQEALGSEKSNKMWVTYLHNISWIHTPVSFLTSSLPETWIILEGNQLMFSFQLFLIWISVNS